MKKCLQENDRIKSLRRLRASSKSRTRKPAGNQHNVNLERPLGLSAPKIFDVTVKKERSSLLDFISKVRQIACHANSVTLDFSKVTSMEPHATLLLWSELCRIKKKKPACRIRATLPLSLKCRQVFSQVGLARLLGKSLNVKPTFEDVIHWRATTGKGVEGKKYAEELMNPYDGVLPKEVAKSLYVGVQEAMTNVRQHAYTIPRGDQLSQDLVDVPDDDWWMFSQERDSKLTVLICDLGAGIPGTIPNSNLPLLNSIKRWMRLGNRLDGDVLSAALKKTVNQDLPKPSSKTMSQTGKHYRGKGLYNIVKTVREVDGGAVLILSNKGMWHSNHTREQSKSSFNTSIMGTIISWQIPLGEPSK